MGKKSMIISLIVLITILFGSGIYYSAYIFTQNSGQVMADTKQETGKVIDASKNFLEPGINKRLMIMELGATTCIPCKMMVPILEELAKELQGKVDIQFVDVYKRGDLAEKNRIFAIPTQIFFDKNGKEIFRHQGFYPKAEIMTKLKEFGVK